MKRKILFILILPITALIIFSNASFAQTDSTGKKEGYRFTIDKKLEATPVKNQYKSSTCWDFSTLSFLESELLREGKGPYDLSEMFIVHNTYIDKARRYVRWQGNINFAAGGAFHDATRVFANIGIVPEEVYNGKVIGEPDHIHGEMDGVLRAYIDAVLKNENGKLTPVWLDGLQGILDAYLGPLPEKFNYQGNEYTPKSFAASLGLNMDDYVEITSFTHHPFYSKFVIEIPDNWMFGELYNVPLDEMLEIINNSIELGYTVA
jgi:bleomycin hydrolase